MAFEKLAKFLGKKNKGPKEGDTRNVPVHFQDETGKGEDRYHHKQETFKGGKWEHTGTVMPLRQKNQQRMKEYKDKKTGINREKSIEALRQLSSDVERNSRVLNPPARNARHEIADDLYEGARGGTSYPHSVVDRRREYDKKLADSSPSFARDTERGDKQLALSKKLKSHRDPGHKLARTFAEYDSSRTNDSAERALENMRLKRKKQGR